MELMSRAEIAEAIAALDLGAEGSDELLDNPGLAQEGVEEWMPLHLDHLFLSN